MIPRSCAAITTPPMSKVSLGNGFSSVRCSPFQIQAAAPFSRIRSPIVTVTTVSACERDTVWITSRSITTPPTNEITSVRKKATQYGTRSSSSQQMNVENIAISPCAKLTTPVER